MAITPLRVTSILFSIGSFTNKDPAETIYFWFDFSLLLNAAETVSSITSVNVTTLVGSDPSPNAIKSGAAAIEGNAVKQLLTAGTATDTYQITATIVTSAARTLTLIGNLPVATL
jgi:hypothetical protein